MRSAYQQVIGPLPETLTPRRLSGLEQPRTAFGVLLVVCRRLRERADQFECWVVSVLEVGR